MDFTVNGVDTVIRKLDLETLLKCGRLLCGALFNNIGIGLNGSTGGGSALATLDEETSAGGVGFASSLA